MKRMRWWRLIWRKKGVGAKERSSYARHSSNAVTDVGDVRELRNAELMNYDAAVVDVDDALMLVFLPTLYEGGDRTNLSTDNPPQTRSSLRTV